MTETARATWGKAQDAAILGLTLIQPWATVVVHHGKRIENRPWKPPAWALGKRLAIHAGKKYDNDVAADLWTSHRISVPTKSAIALGAIIGTARLYGFIDGDEGSRLVALDQRRWFFGPFGWLLEDVRPLATPIPCAGALGLWRLPEAVEAQLR